MNLFDGIIEHVRILQKKNPAHHIRFTLFDDCSGSFGYYDMDGYIIEIESFDTLLELEKLLKP